MMFIGPRFSPTFSSPQLQEGKASLWDFVSASNNGQPYGRYATEEPPNIPRAVRKGRPREGVPHYDNVG